MFAKSWCLVLVAGLALLTVGCEGTAVQQGDLDQVADLAAAPADFAFVDVAVQFDSAISADLAEESPDLAIAPCGSLVCANGGTCVVGVDGASCVCAAGYTGETCDIDIDDCSPDPCDNGGTCVDGVDTFTCTCPPGYTGDTCDIDIDDCSPNPCNHSGTCVDGVDTFACTCPPGYTGDTCDIDIDDCSPNPCDNGGTCVDGVNTFTCTCPAAWAGKTCRCPTAPLTADYRLLATSHVSELHDVPLRAHVIGSAEVSTTPPYGVGIAGGSDDRAVDGAETMDFAFDFPTTMLTLHIGAIINVDLDATLWELTVEAFDPMGTSLGIKNAPSQSIWDLTSLYEGALIGRVRISGNPDGVIVRLLDVTYQCD